MITLNAADEPERGFVADYSLTGSTRTGDWIWSHGRAFPADAPAYLLTTSPNSVPWLSEWREPTISLTHSVTTSVASGGISTIMFNFPPKES